MPARPWRPGGVMANVLAIMQVIEEASGRGGRAARRREAPCARRYAL
jgi:hypothetical protein